MCCCSAAQMYFMNAEKQAAAETVACFEQKKGGFPVTQRQQKMIWLAAVIIFVLFCVLATVFLGIPMMRLAKEPEQFRTCVESFGFWGRVLFVLMVVLQVIVALIPGEPLELAAGYAYGAVEGSLLAMAGILIGSAIVFLAVRLVGPKLVAVFFPDREIRRLAFLRDPQKAGVLTFILMTIPGTPKDLLSYFAGLTPLSMPQWLLIVAVARIPSLLTSTVSGAAAGEENYLLAGVMLAVTLLVSGIGVMYYRKLCKDSEQKDMVNPC